MTIGRVFAARNQKLAANNSSPSEALWAEGQPVRWRTACKALAVASNTRGGIVGKSETQIVREANEAGITITLRTFERRIAILQAYGLVYKDEKNAVQVDHGRFRQPGSTWMLKLEARMPEEVPLTCKARWTRQSIGDWLTGHGIPTSSWQDSPAYAIPF